MLPASSRFVDPPGRADDAPGRRSAGGGGRAQSGQRARRRRPALAAAPPGRARQRLARRAGRGDRRGRSPHGRAARGHRPGPGRRLGTGRRPRRRRGPAGHVAAVARRARDDLRRLRPARAASGAGQLDEPARLDPARTDPLRLPGRPRHRPEPVPQQGHACSSPSRSRHRTAARPTRCCTGRCGTSRGSGRARAPTCRPGSRTTVPASGSPTSRSKTWATTSAR